MFLQLLNGRVGLCLPVVEGERQLPPKQATAQVSGGSLVMEAELPDVLCRCSWEAGHCWERCLCPDPVGDQVI